MSLLHDMELADTLEAEALRRGRPLPRTQDDLDFRLACALNERDRLKTQLATTRRRLRALTATPPVGRHCGFCGQPRCECGLRDYITEAPR